MVYSRLARRLRATGKKSFEEYPRLLEGGGRQRWRDFVNALTTNLTSFFRESHHFPVLRSTCRTQVETAHQHLVLRRSTGEEPYSIAITAMEAFRQPRAAGAHLATDIDTNVLSTAQTGSYREDRSVARMEPTWCGAISAVPAPTPVSSGVRPEVAGLVTFRPLNLLARAGRCARASRRSSVAT